MGNYKDDRNSSSTIKRVLLYSWINITKIFFSLILLVSCSCSGERGIDTTPQVRAITGDNTGKVYIGFGNKLTIFDGSNWNLINLPYDEMTKGVISLNVDSDGIIWVGTNEGIYKISGDRIEFIEEVFSALKCQFVNHIVEDADDNLWFSAGCLSIDPVYEWGG